MRGWWLVTAVVMVAVAEKLGDLEVITRRELSTEEALGIQHRSRTAGTDNLELPSVVQNEPLPQPLPALTYLPPSQTPLPIETNFSPEAAISQTSTITLPDGTQFTPQVPPNVEPELESPNLPADIFASPNPEVAVGGPVGEAGEEKGFFEGVKDSKLALLGGVVGAKSAVAQGFRDAKESIVSGITSAITAKAQAFSTLTNKGFDNNKNNYYYAGNGGGTGGQGYYNPNYYYYYGGSGTGNGQYYQNNNNNHNNGGGDSTGSGSDNSDHYQSSNIGGSSGNGDSGAQFVPAPYPLYPPYPQSYYPPKPFYPLVLYPVRPAYRPKSSPLASLKSKLKGLVAAKEKAVVAVVSKVQEAKSNLKSKFTGVFQKGQEPAYLTYPNPSPVNPKPQPIYPQPQPIYSKPQPVYPKPQPVYPKPEPGSSKPELVVYPTTQTTLEPINPVYPYPVKPIIYPAPLPIKPAYSATKPVYPTANPSQPVYPGTLPPKDAYPTYIQIHSSLPVQTHYPTYPAYSTGEEDGLKGKALAKLKSPFQYFRPSYAYSYGVRPW